MRWREAVAAAPWHVETAEKPNLVIDLPAASRNPRGRFSLSVRSKEPILAEFVTAEGLMVPVGPVGSSIDFLGSVADFVAVNLHVKKNSDVAYKAFFVGPKRLFETPDPTPVSVSTASDMKPDVRNQMRDLVEAITENVRKKFGLAVDPEDLVEDVADDLFEWEERIPQEDLFEQFGRGHMEPDPPPPVEEFRQQNRPEADPGPAVPDPKQGDLEDAIRDVGREPPVPVT